ncbi:restriction endonuclease subunit S [candidate division WOR-3 bacterium]|nr:restriction endonuclease subunit S [candidate division WOR-3 bacterium]
MPSEWRESTLGDLCLLVTDGAHASPRTVSDGRPMASVKDLTRHGITTETCRRISLSDFDRLVRDGCQPKRNDVLMAKDGASCLETVCVFDQPDELVLLSSVALFRPGPDLDAHFLRYYLEWPRTKDLLRGGYVSGSAIPRVVLRDFKAAPVSLPPLPLQRAIARVLGTLDDKIELNRKMNETLEAMARAIFKSWFVDFEPFQGKGMVDSELGPIPKRWEVQRLGNVADVVKGRSYSSTELQPSSVALVTLKSFCRGGGYRPEGLKPYTGAYKPEQVIQPGEVVISFTDVTQAAEVIGRPAVVRAAPAFDTLVASLDVGIVRAKPEYRYLCSPYFYYLLACQDFVGHILGYVNGTTVLHLDKEGIPEYRFVCPPEPVASGFAALAVPVYKRMDLADRESCLLAAARDALLPKLMSGEVRATRTA